MKKHFNPVSGRLTLLFFASAFSSGMAFAADNQSPQAHVSNLGFNASITTSEALVSQPLIKECPLRGVSVGWGTSTLFGQAPVDKATLGASDCVTIFGNGAVLDFKSGKFVLTSASTGESIFAEYSGSFVFKEPLSTTKMSYTMSGGQFRITGGTGKYKNASGSGTLSGSAITDVNPAIPAQGQFEAKGLITY
jgi:hypothetical protein